MVPIFNKTIFVTAESATFWSLGFVFGVAVESAADNMANITGIECFTETVSIIDSAYSAYYFINQYYTTGEKKPHSNKEDIFSLIFAGAMAVKAVDSTRRMECFGVGDYVNGLLFAGIDPDINDKPPETEGGTTSGFINVNSANPSNLPVVYAEINN